jgi:hypothetical protein
LVVGCGESDTKGTGSTSSESASGAITVDDLLFAPVPELCGHEPGMLANGVLPLQDPLRGTVGIASESADDPSKYRVALGDLTGDGIDDGAMVMWCTAGGVAWPQTVELYTEGPTRLGGVNLGELTGGRDYVTALNISDQVVHVEWMTNGPADAGCCPTVPMLGDLRWDGQQVVAENVRAAG